MPAHARKRRGAADVAGAARRAGRGWRRSRPFWGAVIILMAGGETGAVRFTLPLRTTWTLLPAGLLIAGGMIACGLLLLFDPAQRSLYAVAAILLSITALETSHLGGYLIGTLLGLGGGATAFAWVPGLPPARPAQSGLTLIMGEARPPAGAPPRRHRQPGGRPAGSPGRLSGTEPLREREPRRERERD
ncbi:MAG TPA: DUF6114 domain-containing protein [Streptosporangiaceae bacterium]|nr:DUF6114 domain-containing protein [Streptosporangiaceae bacterium]